MGLQKIVTGVFYAVRRESSAARGAAGGLTGPALFLNFAWPPGAL
jgi:hypothetical protein